MEGGISSINKETRVIKFYLDESVNQIKKDKILKFLLECQQVQNYLFAYYWNDEKFTNIINNRSKVDFNYKCINYKDCTPRLKSHHFQQVSQQVFANLKSLESNIINRIHFKFDDKEKQMIYNYCCGFCFDWEWLVEHTDKQLSKYNKKKYDTYYEFLLKIKECMSNKRKFNKIKKEIENSFWEIKSKQKCPVKKEFQIICNKLHTVDIQTKEFQWIFIIDNNELLGENKRGGIYDKLVIPVKYSEYHKEKLQDKKLANSFNLKLNRHNKIEIIAFYEIEVENPEYQQNTELIGIDIGLKKLITSSDGEIIEQNEKILKKLNRVIKKQSNRDKLENHLQEKYQNKEFRLCNNRYLLQQVRLTDFVKCDNRYQIKNFLKPRLNQHIIMEDLNISSSKTYNKRVNYLLRRLQIQNIKNDIIKYSKEYGIEVSLINPAFTSQECPICGYVSKENRKTQETFCCVKCNHTDNADHNASVNIMNRIYNTKIKLNTPYWKVKELLNIE